MAEITLTIDDKTITAQEGMTIFQAAESAGIEIPHLNLVISASILNDVLAESEKTRTWVGQKQDGIYIGFKKKEMLMLEKITKIL